MSGIKFLIHPVGYLNNEDIDDRGNIVNKKMLKYKNIVLMLQANFCHYCSLAKPAFQEFAEIHQDNVLCLTVQADSDVFDQRNTAKKLIKNLPQFEGYPHYILFRDGKITAKNIWGRDVRDLESFVTY